MRIKQYSQATNLPAKTIRYYEKIGLLPPPKRLDNDYRDYDETDIDRARLNTQVKPQPKGVNS